jgi:hypothetical protein
VLIWALVACRKETPPEPTPDVGTGPLGAGWADPFPNAALVEDGHLALVDLPSGGETPLPVERLAWRDGFSPAQVSVLRLDGVDDSGFPRQDPITPGQGTVRMVDLTDRRDVACFAELDAYPNADQRAVLVRPLEALKVGHHIAVAVLTEAVARPERFDLLLSDQPPASLADVAPAYRALMDDLDAFGIPADDIAVAWDFPVGDGTRPLTSALEQVADPGGHAFTSVRNLDDGDTVAPFTWRAAEGTYRVQNLIDDQGGLVLGDDGSVTVLGETDAYLYAHVPTSVKDRPAGTVPVMIFGHGIFGEPALYLDDPTDPDKLLQLADEAGFIVLATEWRGLSKNDLSVPLGVATDFGTFPHLTDLLVQAQLNVRTLAEEARTGDLLDDPVFQGAAGQPLADKSHLYYYGISLGAIEGAVFLANDPPVQAGALHVGGASWSTMLERSSNWSAFELLIGGTIPSASDRQVLYALSQLWWDPVDPMSWTAPLSTRSFLLQESIGDDQVPNLTTEALARSIALPVLDPTDKVPYGLQSVAGPLPPGSRALVRFDPELPLPTTDNRPAAVTHAHEAPRTWPGTREQVEDHLLEGQEGQVVHHCGDAICSADNPGEER